MTEIRLIIIDKLLSLAINLAPGYEYKGLLCKHIFGYWGDVIKLKEARNKA